MNLTGPAATIPWRPWGQEAFDEARRLGRPVLLRLSAGWCHWCHVQKEKADTDPAVVAAVARRFVPVLVDVDRRPDLSERFARGGLPTTAILTAGAEPLSGATFLEAPELIRFLEAGLADHEAARRASRPSPSSPATASAASKSLGEIGDAFARAVLDGYDWKNHGFGLEPKFPQPQASEFLLAVGLRRGAPFALKAGLLSLSVLPKTELWDPVDGGFFRYCERARWREPHFEKLLEGNARLLGALSAAAGWSGGEDLRRAALETAAFIDRMFSIPDGNLWGGSQAPDEEYYSKMSHRREAQGAPPVDPTVYMDWNAHAVSAFARAGVCLDERRLIARARLALDELLRGVEGGAGPVPHYREGAGWQGGGLLRDCVGLSAASLDVYCATGEARWLDASLGLAKRMLDAFSDRADGALLDAVELSAAPGGPRLSLLKPPAENGEAAALLLRLSAAGGRIDLREAATSILRALAPAAMEASVSAAPFGPALLAAADGVVIVETGATRVDGAGGDVPRAALAAAFALGPAVLHAGAGAEGAPGTAFRVRDRRSEAIRSVGEVRRALAGVVTLHEAL